MKRPTDGDTSLDRQAKRQRGSTSTNSEPRCRFLDEGYLDVIKTNHASDDRYQGFFKQNSLENISKTLRRCFSPKLLQVLADYQEGDIQA